LLLHPFLSWPIASDVLLLAVPMLLGLSLLLVAACFLRELF